MSESMHDKLVYMANQIGSFFASQPGDQMVGEAEHLRLSWLYWPPALRQKIAYVRCGGAGLDPIPAKAVERLAGGPP